MSYLKYDFPHTRNQDSDLRQIVEMYETLRELPTKFSEFERDFSDNLPQKLNETINDLIANGLINYNYIFKPFSLSTINDQNTGYPQQIYNITENTVINKNILIPKGAIFNIAENITLTINGYIIAGGYQIFEGNGQVLINGNTIALAEWFGNTRIGNDDSVYINKAIESLASGTVLLADGNYTYNEGDLYTQSINSSYYIENPILIKKSNINLAASNRAVIIFNANIAVNVSGIETFVEQSGLRNIFLSYYGLNPFSADVANYAAIKFNNVSRCFIENCRICNYGNGIFFNKTVNCRASNIIFDLLRSGNYNTIGYYIQCFSENSAISPNASLILNNCLANFSATSSSSCGFLIEGNDCRDISLLNCETASANLGIDIEVVDSDVSKFAYDIFIDNFRADLVRECGIKINNLSGIGDIQIKGGWISSSAENISLIDVINSANITITGVSFTQNININGYAIRVNSNADSVTIANCIFTNFSDCIYILGTRVSICNNIFILTKNSHLINKSFHNVVKIEGGYCTVANNIVTTKDNLKYDYLFVTVGSNTNSFIYNIIDASNATSLWLIDDGNISEGINRRV